MKKNWKLVIVMFIICVISGLLGIGVKYVYQSWQFQKLYDSILTEENEVLFLGRPTCGFCTLFKPILDDISGQYKIAYRYINTDTLSKKQLEKLLDKLEIRKSTFSTPRLLVTKKNKIVDSYIGYMDDISLFHFFKKNGLIGEEEEYKNPYPNIERLSSNSYFDLLNEKIDTTILVGRIGDPTVDAMLKYANDKKMNVNFLSPSVFLTEEDYNKFVTTIKDMKEETLLPILLEVKNGEVVKMYEDAKEEMLKEIGKEITFNETEQKIIDILYNKLRLEDYFDKDKLEFLEIIQLLHIGYYESESNIHYFQAEYNSSCNDGTYDCDYLCTNKKVCLEENIPFSFMFKLDIETYDYIEKVDGISIPFHSDWVATDYKVE